MREERRDGRDQAQRDPEHDDDPRERLTDHVAFDQVAVVLAGDSQRGLRPNECCGTCGCDLHDHLLTALDEYVPERASGVWLDRALFPTLGVELVASDSILRRADAVHCPDAPAEGNRMIVHARKERNVRVPAPESPSSPALFRRPDARFVP